MQGHPTFHGRVESWECDFNGHWNTRFYCRSFQTAAEVAAAINGRADPDGVAVTHRHMRFHRELLCNDSFTIDSFDHAVEDEPVTTHRMFRDGRLLATATDFGLPRNQSLPPLPDDLRRLSGPRGLPMRGQPPALAGAQMLELGPALPDEVDAGGGLGFTAAAQRLAVIANHHLTRLGFARDYTIKTNIGRMLAEMRYTRLGPCAPREFLRGTGQIVAASGKSFTTVNLISSHAGAPVAMFETCLLAVNLETRRAVEVPEFVLQAARAPDHGTGPVLA